MKISVDNIARDWVAFSRLSACDNDWGAEVPSDQD